MIRLFYCIAFLILGSDAYEQVYNSLTDSLLSPNKVRTRTRILADGHFGEIWYYNTLGNSIQHIAYRPAEKRQMDNQAMISTDFVYDKANRLVASTTKLMSDFRDQKMMCDLIGKWLNQSDISFLYDTMGRLKEEIHKGIIINSGGESKYTLQYEHAADGMQVTKKSFDMAGKKIQEQLLIYVRSNILARMVSGGIITNYQNRFNKKGQLVGSIRQNQGVSSEFKFSYLPNGLLEKVSGPKNSPESFLFQYTYY